MMVSDEDEKRVVSDLVGVAGGELRAVTVQRVECSPERIIDGGRHGGSPSLGEGVLSVLVVDERDLTETLKLVLQIGGYHAEAVSSGAKALKRALNKHYDLVLMEANLHDSRGTDLARIIRSMDARTRVILMTGDELYEETLRSAPDAVDDVLLKPFPPEELVRTVSRVLEPRGLALPRA